MAWPPELTRKAKCCAPLAVALAAAGTRLLPMSDSIENHGAAPLPSERNRAFVLVMIIATMPWVCLGATVLLSAGSDDDGLGPWLLMVAATWLGIIPSFLGLASVVMVREQPRFLVPTMASALYLLIFAPSLAWLLSSAWTP